jgi:SAM-dependent methyltransferase
MAAGAREVIGVDIDEQAIAEDQKAYPGVTYLVDSCETLTKVSGPFDLICSFENIEHLQKPENFLRAAGRLLSPEGVLLTSTIDRAITPPFKLGRPANPFHTTEWYRDEFAALLGHYFEHVEMRVQVESHGAASRSRAVQALRQGMMWCNPLLMLLWRQTARVRGVRSWKALDALAVRTVADYPIVSAAVAPVWGTSHCHFAICRGPRGA